MIRIHQLLIGLIVAICLICQIQAEVKYNITTADFDSRYATDPYNPSLSFQLGAQRQAIFYQIVTNVKNATFVALPDINLHANGFNVPWPSFLYKYKGGTGGVESTGQVVDPCTFGSQDSTALLTVNATTDAEEGSITSIVGALDIPWLQNATTFEYTNPQVIPAPGVQYNSFVPSRFYRVNFNVSENETWHLEVLSTEAVHIAVAGLGNCPSFKYNNDSAHWSENVPANQAVNTPVIAIKDKSIFWVQVLSEVSANITFTWKLASSNAPGNPVLDLPTWATALLIVFGVVIVVLIIVVIVMCVKNRHRASYNTV